MMNKEDRLNKWALQKFVLELSRSVLFGICSLLLLSTSPLQGQLNQNCTVAVLNRTVQVNADGSWVLPNLPANFGLVRARATCVQNGVTTFGQSALFAVGTNSATNVPSIQIGPTTPIPTSVSVTSAVSPLTQVGGTSQLTVTATYAGNPQTTQNITAASTGTQYTVSNPAVATVTPGGLVTAVSTGTVAVQAVNEGAQGIVSVQVILAGVSHGGIPDSWAIEHGLDPNDPAMPAEDPDHDGLTNLQEFQAGTDPHNPDTDGDGLTDAQEILKYGTNPLIVSTDGTGIPDGVEVQDGTLGGTLAAKLGGALTSIEVKPATFVLVVNTLEEQATQQLSVIGHLIDGKTTIDLTSTLKGTTYSSSSLNVCNFGTPDGNVFAGSSGTCVITVSNGRLSAQATGTVSGFSPTALGYVSIPGFANGVAVNGNTVYIAAGSAGLQVVDVTNKSQPTIVAALALTGNANGVRLVGNLAYVAMGAGGVQIVDVANPKSPVLVSTFVTSAPALTLVVSNNIAYVAASSSLLLVNVSNPASPSLISSLSLTGTIEGVDVDPIRKLAVVAAGSNGIYVVDVSNPSKPAVLGAANTGDAIQVAIQNNYAYVADYTTSTNSVDITTPSSPMVLSHISDPNLGGFLQDIFVNGNFALAADVKFFNGIPITDISVPSQLQARAILDFTQRDDNGMGIAGDGSYVYLVTEHSNLSKFGTTGDSRLYIGQYRPLQDLKGIPPTASITSPTAGMTVVQGSTLPILVNAADDVAVAGVNFLVNGATVFASSSYPYQYNYPVPTTASTIVLGATAVDFGGNVGAAKNVTVKAIPDPGTTIVGRVVDKNGAPIAGAALTFGSLTATALPDGTFTIRGAPTVQGNIVVIATAVVAGRTERGRSTSTPPVLAGTTNVGDIRLAGGKIALIACDSNTTVINALVNTGQIAASDLTFISGCGTAPDLATLSTYGAVLVWSNDAFGAPVDLGNVLANYVDQGGGVVLATYVFSQNWYLGGRITTTGYSPFTVSTQFITPSGSLDLAKSNTSSPIMQGVTAQRYFINSNYTNPALTPGSSIIAVDTNGNNVVAISPNQVLGISIYPGFGDMGTLFANALNYLR